MERFGVPLPLTPSPNASRLGHAGPWIVVGKDLQVGLLLQYRSRHVACSSQLKLVKANCSELGGAAFGLRGTVSGGLSNASTSGWYVQFLTVVMHHRPSNSHPPSHQCADTVL